MIIYRPVKANGRGANVANDVIDNAIRTNPDGFGISHRTPDGIVTERFDPSRKAEFRAKLRQIDNKGGEYVAHFRFATHGPKDEAHAHPYEYTHEIDGRVLVFHNGIIPIGTKDDESDTEVFVRDVLAFMPSRWWEQDHLLWLVTEAIGWSKLIVMTDEGTYNLQDRRGTWDSGIWYSAPHKPITVTHSSRWYGGENGWLRKQLDDSEEDDWVNYRSRDTHDGAFTVVEPVSKDRVEIPNTFMHAGHRVEILAEIGPEPEATYTDAVMCLSCYEWGDIYVIEGQRYCDLEHDMDHMRVEERSWDA